MCAHRCHGVGSQPRANVYNRTSAVFFGCRIMKPLFGGFTSVPPQKNDNFMAKMEKCCFLFAKNDYLIGITFIFSLK